MFGIPYDLMYGLGICASAGSAVLFGSLVLAGVLPTIWRRLKGAKGA